MSTETQLAEKLRQAVSESEKSQAKIALDAGMTPPQLSRFVTRKKTLTIESASRLAQVLNLELTKQGRPHELS